MIERWSEPRRRSLLGATVSTAVASAPWIASSATSPTWGAVVVFPHSAIVPRHLAVHIRIGRRRSRPRWSGVAMIVRALPLVGRDVRGAVEFRDDANARALEARAPASAQTARPGGGRPIDLSPAARLRQEPRLAGKADDPLPRHRPEGRQCVRLRRARWTTLPSTTTIPPRRRAPSTDIGFRWLHVVDLDGAVAGETRERRGGGGDTRGGRRRMQVQLGGGIRDRDAHRVMARKGRGPHHPRHSGAARPGPVRQAGGEHSGRVAVGIEPAAARWRSRAGWRHPTSRRPFSPRNSSTPAWRRSSTPTSTATACSPASTGTRRSRSPTSVSIPAITSGGLASMADIERLTRPDAGESPARSRAARSGAHRDGARPLARRFGGGRLGRCRRPSLTITLTARRYAPSAALHRFVLTC